MGQKRKRKPKNPKGSVTVESFRGRLRLRLPRHVFGGAKKYLSLYLPDTPDNRKVAMAKTQIIESDIALERFDTTLQRYKTPYASDDSPSLIELWQKYTEWKAPHIAASTLNKDFKKTANHIRQLPTQRISQARLMRDWLVTIYLPMPPNDVSCGSKVAPDGPAKRELLPPIRLLV